MTWIIISPTISSSMPSRQSTVSGSGCFSLYSSGCVLGSVLTQAKVIGLTWATSKPTVTGCQSQSTGTSRTGTLSWESNRGGESTILPSRHICPTCWAPSTTKYNLPHYSFSAATRVRVFSPTCEPQCCWLTAFSWSLPYTWWLSNCLLLNTATNSYSMPPYSWSSSNPTSS